MATSSEYLDFILQQLSLVEGISHRRMMGEYIIYHRGKIAAYLCDNRLLVKMLPATKAKLPNAPCEAPYEGAKEMLLVEAVDDRKFLRDLFECMYDQLPESVKRKKKT